MRRQSLRALLRLIDSEPVDDMAAYQAGVDGLTLDMSRVIPAGDESLYSIAKLNREGLDNQDGIMCATCGSHVATCSQQRAGRRFEPCCQWCVDDGYARTTITTFARMQRISTAR